MCRSCSFAIDDEIMRAFEINLLVYYENLFMIMIYINRVIHQFLATPKKKFPFFFLFLKTMRCRACPGQWNIGEGFTFVPIYVFLTSEH